MADVVKLARGYAKCFGFTDAQGRTWKHRKPDGWLIDEKCPDGFTCSGFRRVTQKRRFRFGGSYWTHESYAPGDLLYVRIEDPLGARVSTRRIDPTWTPDNIADDYRAFLEHASDLTDVQIPEAVGDWNARKAKG